MSWEDILGLVVTAALFVYLLRSMLRAGRE